MIVTQGVAGTCNWHTHHLDLHLRPSFISIPEQGFKHAVSNKKCVGSPEGESDCQNAEANMNGNKEDAPAPLDWKMKPIWEMSVPGLSQGAKDAMKETFHWVLEGAVECSRDRCSGKGACGVNTEAWQRVQDHVSVNNIDFFDGNNCFCEDGAPENEMCSDLKEFEFLGNSPPKNIPLRKCQGDCDFDSD